MAVACRVYALLNKERPINAVLKHTLRASLIFLACIGLSGPDIGIVYPAVIPTDRERTSVCLAWGTCGARSRQWQG